MDRNAYEFSGLGLFHEGLKRRDISARTSDRFADPRARLGGLDANTSQNVDTAGRLHLSKDDALKGPAEPQMGGAPEPEAAWISTVCLSSS